MASHWWQIIFGSHERARLLLNGLSLYRDDHRHVSYNYTIFCRVCVPSSAGPQPHHRHGTLCHWKALRLVPIASSVNSKHSCSVVPSAWTVETFSANHHFFFSFSMFFLNFWHEFLFLRFHFCYSLIVHSSCTWRCRSDFWWWWKIVTCCVCVWYGVSLLFDAVSSWCRALTVSKKQSVRSLNTLKKVALVIYTVHNYCACYNHIDFAQKVASVFLNSKLNIVTIPETYVVSLIYYTSFVYSACNFLLPRKFCIWCCINCNWLFLILLMLLFIIGSI